MAALSYGGPSPDESTSLASHRSRVQWLPVDVLEWLERPRLTYNRMLSAYNCSLAIQTVDNNSRSRR